MQPNGNADVLPQPSVKVLKVSCTLCQCCSQILNLHWQKKAEMQRSFAGRLCTDIYNLSIFVLFLVPLLLALLASINLLTPVSLRAPELPQMWSQAVAPTPPEHRYPCLELIQGVSTTQYIPVQHYRAEKTEVHYSTLQKRVWDETSCGCSQGSHDIQQPKWHATVKSFDERQTKQSRFPDPAASPAHWGAKQKMRSANATPPFSQDAEVIWSYLMWICKSIVDSSWYMLISYSDSTWLHHFHDSKDRCFSEDRPARTEDVPRSKEERRPQDIKEQT